MDTGAAFDFLDFNFDVQEEKENTQKLPTHGLAIPDFAEEELEWLSNKDAFPSVESCLDILSDPLPPKVLNHHSPVSVLDNINLNNTNNIKNGNNVGVFTLAVRYPMKARSTGIQRKRLSRFPDPPIQHFVLWGQENARRKQLQQQKQKLLQQKRQLQQQQQQGADVAVTERKCTHCQVDKTPQWRAGPMGPKTLCNACGVRYKSGRLVPEYRPANSPTFSSTLHSNSHRKVIEMRKQKEMCGEQVDKPCAYNRVA